MGKFINLTNQRFGRLMVINLDHIVKGKSAFWKCLCDCGNFCIITSSNLIQNRTKSCGCYHKEQVSFYSKKYNKYNLLGEFGIGYTIKNEKFYFDLDDYDKIKGYCWCKNKDGYIINSTNGILMHRLIMNSFEGKVIDHINPSNKYDNRKENLRLATKSENEINCGNRKNNKSGFKGVSYNNITKKWVAQIMVNRKCIQLGSYKNIKFAIDARRRAEIKYFGKFAYQGYNHVNR